MKKKNVNIKNAEPEFQASVGERQEEVAAGVATVLTRAQDAQEDGGWENQHVCVLNMAHRPRPYLTTENFVKGAYVGFAEPLGDKAPAFLIDDKGEAVAKGEMGTFNSKEIHVGMDRGVLFMQSAK